MSSYVLLKLFIRFEGNLKLYCYTKGVEQQINSDIDWKTGKES